MKQYITKDLTTLIIAAGGQDQALIADNRGTLGYFHLTVKFNAANGSEDTAYDVIPSEVLDYITTTIRHDSHTPIANRTLWECCQLDYFRTGNPLYDVPTNVGFGENEDIVLEVRIPYVEPRRGPEYEQDTCELVRLVNEIEFQVGAAFGVNENITIGNITIEPAILFDPMGKTVGLEWSFRMHTFDTSTPILTGSKRKVTDVWFKGKWEDAGVWALGTTATMYQGEEAVYVTATSLEVWQLMLTRGVGFAAAGDDQTENGADARLSLTPLLNPGGAYALTKIPQVQYRFEFGANPANAQKLLYLEVLPMTEKRADNAIPGYADLNPMEQAALVRPAVPAGAVADLTEQPELKFWLPLKPQKGVTTGFRKEAHARLKAAGIDFQPRIVKLPKVTPLDLLV